MSIKPTSATLALSAALGCTINLPGTSDETGSTPDTTTDPGDESSTGTGSTSIEPTSTTGETTSVPTTGETGEPTSSTGDTGGEPVWCNGYDPRLATLSVHNNANMPIADGSPLAAECGGQGSLMVAIFPHFGGFVPDGDGVTFDVVLDVEGFNLGPSGHFFETNDHYHQINCAPEDTYGGYYSYSFIAMFPPDAIPDINAIDGKPGVLKVTLHTPDGEVPFEADVVMEAAIGECGYGAG